MMDIRDKRKSWGKRIGKMLSLPSKNISRINFRSYLKFPVANFDQFERNKYKLKNVS